MGGYFRQFGAQLMRGEIAFSSRDGSKADEVQLLGKEAGKVLGTQKDGRSGLSLASQLTWKMHALRRLVC